MFLITIFIFLIGLCVGSFLNVVLFRTYEGQSVIFGRSKCRTCQNVLEARDLIPVLSYVFLNGRCRGCHSVIAWQYPVIEIVAGLLFVLMYLKGSWGMSVLLIPQELFVLLIRDWVFVSYLIVIFVYDLRHMLIIDRFTVPAMIFAVLVNLWLGVIPAWSIILGGLVLAFFFWTQFFFSKGTWVGGGDIRMGALMGFMLGLEQGLVALFLSYLLGAIVGAVLLLSGKVDRKTPIPFGTFLTVGTTIALFAGPAILEWYLGLFG